MYKIIIIILICISVKFLYHYDIFTYIAININPSHYFNKAYKNLPRVKCKYPVIVCMTTTPIRFDNCKYTIASILNQTVKVDQIRLHIPNRSDYIIPKWLISLAHNIKEVNVIRCDRDWGPATKLIPVLLDKDIDTNSCIIYIDDDMIYNKNTIETLVSYSNIYPKSAICNKGWNIDKYPENKINLFSDYLLGLFTEKKRYVDIIQGFSAVLVKSSFFDVKKLIDTDRYPKEAFFVDDVVISGNLNDNNIDRISTCIPSSLPYIREIVNEMFKKPTSLATIHNKNKRNDKITANFFRWKKQIKFKV